MVGIIVRRKVEEGPAFIEMAKKSVSKKVPVVELFRTYWRSIV